MRQAIYEVKLLWPHYLNFENREFAGTEFHLNKSSTV